MYCFIYDIVGETGSPKIILSCSMQLYSFIVQYNNTLQDRTNTIQVVFKELGCKIMGTYLC